MSDLTIHDITRFITSQATAADIDRIYEVAKIRSRHLRDIRAAEVAVGDTVVIKNISPKALVGLSGVVTKIDGVGKYCTVTLDARSTRELAHGRTKHSRVVPLGAESYDFSGIPLSCCDTGRV